MAKKESAESTIRNILKKRGRNMGPSRKIDTPLPGRKLEIIHLVEHANLSVKQTMEELEVPRSTFYRSY
jgi:hypothetical protein